MFPRYPRVIPRERVQIVMGNLLKPGRRAIRWFDVTKISATRFQCSFFILIKFSSFERCFLLKHDQYLFTFSSYFATDTWICILFSLSQTFCRQNSGDQLSKYQFLNVRDLQLLKAYNIPFICHRKALWSLFEIPHCLGVVRRVCSKRAVFNPKPSSYHRTVQKKYLLLVLMSLL